MNLAVSRHVSCYTRSGNGTKLGVRDKHVIGQGNGRKGGIDLRQIDRHGKLGGQNLFKSEGVQENAQTDRTQIQEKHSVQKLPVFRRHEVEKDHEIHVETEKVFGPKVKELDHAGGNLVELLVLGRPAVVRGTSVLETCNGKPCANQYVRPKDINVLENAASQGGSKCLPRLFVVIDRAKDAHEGKENVFVDKGSRQDGFVRVVSGVVQLGQDFEGKVGRGSLKNT